MCKGVLKFFKSCFWSQSTCGACSKLFHLIALCTNHYASFDVVYYYKLSVHCYYQLMSSQELTSTNHDLIIK